MTLKGSRIGLEQPFLFSNTKFVLEKKNEKRRKKGHHKARRPLGLCWCCVLLKNDKKTCFVQNREVMIVLEADLPLNWGHGARSPPTLVSPTTTSTTWCKYQSQKVLYHPPWQCCQLFLSFFEVEVCVWKEKRLFKPNSRTFHSYLLLTSLVPLRKTYVGKKVRQSWQHWGAPWVRPSESWVWLACLSSFLFCWSLSSSSRPPSSIFPSP